MMKQWWNKKKNEIIRMRQNRHGFTLVELMVVMIIMIILITVSAGAIINYQQYAIYRKNNEYAQSVFNAAQASLARSKASGTLEDFYDAASKQVDDGEIQKANVLSGSENNGTNMYRLEVKTSDYELMSEAGTSTQAGILYQLLSPYLVDSTVMNASIIVEIDLKDGVVQGVFYNDRAASLNYAECESVRGDAKERRKSGLGYYGTDTSQAAPGNQNRLVISSVELLNKEVLELKWSLKKSQMSESSTANYKIQLFSNLDGVKYPDVMINVEGSKGNIISADARKNNPSLRQAEVEFHDRDTDALLTSSTLDVDCYFETTNDITSVHLILDAVDLDLVNQTAAGLGLTVDQGNSSTVRKTSNEFLTSLYPGNSNGTEESGTLAKSMSIRRLGLDCENDIYAKISATSENYSDSKERLSNSENPYFAKLEMTTDDNPAGGSTSATTEPTGAVDDPLRYTISIANARHLFNATFEEEMVATDTKDKENLYRAMTYLQTDDFTWRSALKVAALGGAQGDTDTTITEVPVGLLEGGYAYGTVTVTDDKNAAHELHQRIIDIADTDMPAFRSFELLHKGNTYDGNGKTATGFIYHLNKLPGWSETANVDSLGFIRENQGLVTNLTLDEAQVNGAVQSSAISEADKIEDLYDQAINYVGAVCGKLTNGGQVIDSKVLGSTVTGKMYVGGLIGAIDLNSTADLTYEDTGDSAVSGSSSEANVNGWSYVGGITGGVRLSTTEYDGAAEYKYNQIADSKNYGAVRSLSLTTSATPVSGTTTAGSNAGIVVPSDSSCIGGIAGYSQHLQISGCTSEMQLTAEEQKTLDVILGNTSASDTQQTEAIATSFQTKGNFVGGIAGYSGKYSNITECSTGEGYIIGGNFVGGIAGYYDGTTANQLTGEASNGTQAANVIGVNFVGGVVGMNAHLDTDTSDLINTLKYEDTKDTDGKVVSTWVEKLVSTAVSKQKDDIEKKNTLPTLDNWKNSGYAIANRKYAGGIAGFNTGNITNCQCEINTSGKVEIFKAVSKAQGSENAEYVGGLAGYNNGTITSKNELRIVPLLNGKNFVGGMVGYNDISGELSGYYLDGGNILGTSFVGGVAGINYSEKIFRSDSTVNTLRSNPNEVRGDYYVGGVIGANFAVVTDETLKLQLPATTNQFLGSIGLKEGDNQGAFTGGFIGANMLLKKQDTDNATVWEDKTAALTDILLNEISTIGTTTTADFNTAVTNMASYMNGDRTDSTNVLGTTNTSFGLYTCKYVNDKNSAGNIMEISGTKDAPLSNYFAGITGGVYVGGVVGFNSRQTSLKLSYIQNMTPVTATTTITDTSRAEKYTLGNTDASGNKIKSITTTYFSYAGGITGLVSDHTTVSYCSNTNQGRVTTQISSEASARVRTYTGNIAEVNEGTITHCTTSDLGSMNSSYVGGIAGINGKANSGKGTKAAIKACTVTGIIRGKDYIGGITAENYGDITVDDAEGSFNDKANWNVLNGTVTGTGSFVGGIAARNADDATVRYVQINSGAAVGVSGTCVGGVIGGNLASISTTTISSVSMDPQGSITVRGNADVGGIIGRQEANGQSQSISLYDLIEEDSTGLENYAAVTAFRGNAGGIIGVVAAGCTINLEQCVNHGTVEAQLTSDTSTTITNNASASNAGGITANLGSGSTIRLAENYGSVTARSGNAGGIVAINNGVVKGCTVGSTEMPITITGAMNAGGFCAENNGTIEKDVTTQTVATADGTGTTETVTKNQLAGTAVECASTTTAGSIGGFVGINTSFLADCVAASDANNTVTMHANGSNLGGVAGKNTGIIGGTKNGDTVTNENGELSIEGTELVVNYKNGANTQSLNGNVGGIAGMNSGIIQQSYFSTDNEAINTDLKLSFNGGAAYGYGGIAGINQNTSDITGTDQVSGIIRNCNVKVAMQVAGSASETANMGGIVGINKEKSQITGVHVYAGTYLYCSVSSYMGGIAGMNLGDISWSYNAANETYQELRDNEAYTTFTEKELTALAAKLNPNGFDCRTYYTQNNRNADYTKWEDSNKKTINPWDMVRIINQQGRTGGIVGIMGNPDNKSEGLKATVTHTGTGENWYVSNNKSLNDAACGGIIGYSYATANLSDLCNFATVIYTASNANSAGGILGRWENEEGIAAIMTNCENYGTIDALRCGGMIGQLKYNGMTFTDCNNYGTLISNNEGCAGMVGNLYEITSGQVLLAQNCGNYGDIYGNNANTNAGFFSRKNDGSPVFVFRNCVNAGDICTNDGTPDIGGFLSGDLSNYTQSYEKCRNYGSGYSNWGKSVFNSNYAGITPASSKASLWQCFGVANQLNAAGQLASTKPLSNSNSMTDCYYFITGKEEISEPDDNTKISPKVEVALKNDKVTSYNKDKSYSAPLAVADGITNVTPETIYDSSNNVIENRLEIINLSKFNYKYYDDLTLSGSDVEAYATITMDYSQITDWTNQNTSGIEIHFTYEKGTRRAYLFRLTVYGDDGTEYVLNNENINSYQITGDKDDYGLAYSSITGLFSFYQSRDALDISKESTARFKLEEGHYNKLKLEVFGAYSNTGASKFGVMNSLKKAKEKYCIDQGGDLNGKWTEHTFDGSNGATTIRITEINWTNITNVPDTTTTEPEGDIDLSNVKGKALISSVSQGTDKDHRYYQWTTNDYSGVSIGTVNTEDPYPIEINPNTAGIIGQLKLYKGKDRWKHQINTEYSSLQDIDNALLYYYMKAGTDTEEAQRLPATGASSSANTGGFMLSWQCEGSPTYYDVYVVDPSDPEKKLYSAVVYQKNSAATSIVIPVQNSWMTNNTSGYLTAHVAAYYGDYATEDTTCNVQLNFFLKNPEVSLLLTGLDNNKATYNVRFKNYQEYVDRLTPDKVLTLYVTTKKNSSDKKIFNIRYADTDGDGNGDTWQWKLSSQNDTNYRTIEEGSFGLLGTINGYTGDNVAVISQISIGTEAYSAQTQTQTTTPSLEEFKTKSTVVKNIIKWDNPGLSGVNHGTQSFIITNINSSNNGVQSRFRGEFVVPRIIAVDGTEIEIPVVVAKTEAELAGTSNGLVFTFNNLPEDFEQYEVRVYPWGGKNSIAEYHTYINNKREYKESELIGTYDNPGPLYETVMADDYVLGKTEDMGLIVEATGNTRDGEATYYVIDSTLFRGITGDENNQVQNQQITYCPSNTQNSNWIKTYHRSTPIDLVLNTEIDVSTTTVNATITDPVEIDWKMPDPLKTGTDAPANSSENTDYRSNTFEVILTGYNMKLDSATGKETTEVDTNSKVEIYRGTWSWNSKDKTICSYDEDTKEYKLFVSSTGWNFKKIGIEVICNGTQKSSTNQTLVWMPSTQSMDAENPNPTITTYQLPLDQISSPVVATVGKDDLNYTITWEGISQDQRAYLGSYQVYLTQTDGTEDPLYTVSDPTELAKDEITITADLEAYQGTEVTIRVDAIAAAVDGVQQYRNSDHGKETTLQIPNRLPLVDTVSIDIGYSVDSANAMDQTVFETNGINMTASVSNDPEQKIQTGVSMEYQAGVVDLSLEQYCKLVGETAPATEEDKTNLLTDTEWKSGRKVTADKDTATVDVNTDPKLMTVNWTDGTASITANPVYGIDSASGYSMNDDGTGSKARTASITGLKINQSAQYLLVRFRTTSNSDISSKWSDYYLMRLPKVKFSPVELTAGKITREEDISIQDAGTSNSTAQADLAQNSDNTISLLEDNTATTKAKQSMTYKTMEWNQTAADQTQKGGYEITLHPSEVQETEATAADGGASTDLTDGNSPDGTGTTADDAVPAGDTNADETGTTEFSENPEVKFQVLPNTDPVTNTASPYMISKVVYDEKTKANEVVKEPLKPYTDTTLSSDYQVYEVYLDDLFMGYNDTYTYSVKLSDEITNIYQLEIRPKLRIEVNSKTQVWTYKLLMPDMVNLNTIQIAATASVEVKVLPKSEAASVESLPESSDRLVASDRRQWMLRRNTTKDNYVTDYFRTLLESDNWYDIKEFDWGIEDAEGNSDSIYRWVNHFTAYALNSQDAIAYEIDGSSAKRVYTATQSEENVYHYDIVDLRFVEALVEPLKQIGAPQVEAKPVSVTETDGTTSVKAYYEVSWAMLTGDQVEYLEGYEVYLVSETVDDSGNVTGEETKLLAPVADKTDTFDSSNTIQTRTVDLTDYQGKTVNIYVKAIAKTVNGITKYQNSLNGMKTEVEIPTETAVASENSLALQSLDDGIITDDTTGLIAADDNTTDPDNTDNSGDVILEDQSTDTGIDSGTDTSPDVIISDGGTQETIADSEILTGQTESRENGDSLNPGTEVAGEDVLIEG